MNAAVIALPTAAAQPVPVWKRSNQNWPRGVVELASERRRRREAQEGAAAAHEIQLNMESHLRLAAGYRSLSRAPAGQLAMAKRWEVVQMERIHSTEAERLRLKLSRLIGSRP